MVADARACWLAGGFTEPQADTLRAALTLLDLPRGTWQLNESRSGGRWIVYMGRYDNTEQVERKKAELRGLGVQFRELTTSDVVRGVYCDVLCCLCRLKIAFLFERVEID